MTIKKIIVFGNLLILLVSGQAFAQMRELTFSEKIEHSSDIFEGKVIRKTSYWNEAHTLILTTNTLEVYKVFKGNIATSEVDILTDGGQVGYDIQGSESSIVLKEGDIGIFMVNASIVKENNILFFRTYGDSQGFIKYDLLEKTASDPFKKYNNIPVEVYKAITDKTGQAFREIKVFNIDKPTEPDSKKKCCWFKFCKKKKVE